MANSNVLADPTVISTLVTIIVSVITTVITGKLTNRNQRKEKLKTQFDEILKISIEHPYLEYKEFCCNWRASTVNEANFEKYIRYDNYAVLVFNHLEEVCRFYKFNENEIKNNHVDIKNWLRLHKEIWLNPLGGQYENTDGYSEKFREFVKKQIGE